MAICDTVGHIRVVSPNRCPAFLSLHHSVPRLCERLRDVCLRDTGVSLSHTVQSRLGTGLNLSALLRLCCLTLPLPLSLSPMLNINKKKKQVHGCSKIILTLFRLLLSADLFMADCVNLLAAAPFVFFPSADLCHWASGSSGSLERWIRTKADIRYCPVKGTQRFFFCCCGGEIAVSFVSAAPSLLERSKC